MSEIRPAPYPATTLTKGWKFEINTEQIKKSDTWLLARRGYVRAHLLLLWSEAWEQTPCGSLPNDDRLLSLLVDMEPDEFAKHREVLMRGWWQADDGRLYHDVITERVLEMIANRGGAAARAAAKRARDAAEAAAKSGERPSDERASNAEVTRDAAVTHENVHGEFATNHQPPTTTKSKGKEGATASPRAVFEPPEWIPPETWAAYLKTRTKKRADNNPHALGLIVKSLEGFRSRGLDALASLEASIRGGWTDVYEPKDRGGGRAPSKQADLEARNRAVIERHLTEQPA